MLKLVEFSGMGPKPNFTDAEVFWAMHFMQARRICRKDLSVLLGIGEGTVRTIINILRDSGMLVVSRHGNVLNAVGRSFMDAIPIRVTDLQVPSIAVGPRIQTLIVHGAGDSFVNGSEQRNTAITSGGSGCTLIRCTDGHLFMPPDWDLDVREPALAAEMRAGPELREGDAVVIGSGETDQAARKAAATVALSLL